MSKLNLSLYWGVTIAASVQRRVSLSQLKHNMLPEVAFKYFVFLWEKNHVFMKRYKILENVMWLNIITIGKN